MTATDGSTAGAVPSVLPICLCRARLSELNTFTPLSTWPSYTQPRPRHTTPTTRQPDSIITANTPQMHTSSSPGRAKPANRPFSARLTGFSPPRAAT
eukprot:3011633-Prymnesium_polylepis.1